MPKLINTTTNEPLATDLTASEIDLLVAFGVDVEGREADDAESGAGASADDGVVDEIVETNDEDDTGGSAGGPSYDDDLDDMDRADADRSSAEWFDVDPNDDYESADEQFEEQFEELERRIAEMQTDIGAAQFERDTEITAFNEERYDHHARVRDHLRTTGLAEQIESAFRKIATRDTEFAARSGKKVNLRNATRRFAGDTTVTDLYTRRRKAETGDRCVGVATDMSGSMNGFNAKVALGALAVATSAIGDDFCANGFRKNGLTPLITRANEKFEWRHLDGVRAGGSTPTADGVMNAIDLIEESSKPEKLMIVVTDGKPNVNMSEKNRDGHTGVSYGTVGSANWAVEYARSRGIAVVGLGIGRVSEHKMAQVFGDDGFVMGEMDTLADDLLEAYTAQLEFGDEVTV